MDQRETSALLAPCRLGHLEAPNRFLAQPLEHNQARDDGAFSEPLLAFYRRLRDGNWGVVVMETTATSHDQKCREHALVLSDRAENVASWATFFKEMHAVENNTAWILEISAAGYKNVSGPRHAAYPGQHEFPRGEVLSPAEVEAILDQYVSATRIAFEAGADGIDFKQCHGYLAGLFLRPANTRDDGWGGSFEGRTRFLREYTTRARKTVGDRSFLFTTRLNAWDGGVPGGFGMAGPAAPDGLVQFGDDPERLYTLLGELGYDLVNVSTGAPGIKGIVNVPAGLPAQFYTFQDAAFHAKTTLQRAGSTAKVASTCWSALGPGAMLVGNAHVKHGIDFIGFGRWQLCEPSLPGIVTEAVSRGYNVEDAVEERANVCIACSKCGTGLQGAGPVTCQVHG